MNKKKSILYVFDDINYLSGARKAMISQADVLRNIADVTFLSMVPSRDAEFNKRYRNITAQNNDSRNEMLFRTVRDVLNSRDYGIKEKALRVIYSACIKMNALYLSDKIFWNYESVSYMDNFDVVIVISEGSKMKYPVSLLKKAKKVQWIHTDYVSWRNFSSWTEKITKRDKAIFKRFDNVVCLSEGLKNKLVELYPKLSNRVVAVPNYIQFEKVPALSNEATTMEVDDKVLNLITVGRLEPEKNYDITVETAKKLKDMGVDFHWYFVGSGLLYDEIRAKCAELCVDDCITMTGELKNPYSLMKKCDLFVLLSTYEGTPVTIDEAKILGKYVIATDVGGISDQLEGGFGRTVLPDQSPEYYAEAISKHRFSTPKTVFDAASVNESITRKIKELYGIV